MISSPPKTSQSWCISRRRKLPRRSGVRVRAVWTRLEVGRFTSSLRSAMWRSWIRCSKRRICPLCATTLSKPFTERERERVSLSLRQSMRVCEREREGERGGEREKNRNRASTRESAYERERARSRIRIPGLLSEAFGKPILIHLTNADTW